MRSGLWRSLSGLLSATAFAVGVASPVQWCPCPMHGVALPAQSEHVHAANMAMPAGDAESAPSASHADHDGAGGNPASPHAAHQCTCPGGCCATAPVALLGHTLAVLDLPIAPRSHVAAPTGTVELAESPQLALPFANAPPEFRGTLRSAAQHTT
jgi:hypothetical protein